MNVIHNDKLKWLKKWNLCLIEAKNLIVCWLSVVGIFFSPASKRKHQFIICEKMFYVLCYSLHSMCSRCHLFVNEYCLQISTQSLLVHEIEKIFFLRKTLVNIDDCMRVIWCISQVYEGNSNFEYDSECMYSCVWVYKTISLRVVWCKRNQ